MIRRTLRNSMPLASVIGMAVVIVGCQSTPPAEEQAMEAETAPMESTPMIVAGDQPASDSVTVGSVTLESDGFVVVHAANEDGTPVVPDSIGHVAVAAGTHENVVVPLEAPVAAGDTVHVMLHEDDGEVGVYEFRTGSTDVDLPVMVDEAPVIVPLTIQ